MTAAHKIVPAVDNESLDIMFNNARTHNVWLNKPVEDALLHNIWNIARMGPTSANSSPMRVVFVKSPEAKAKLKPCLNEGNKEKTMQAPVTAIFANDHEFYEKLPKLFPHTDAKSWFVGNQALIDTTAFRNGTLQAAYFMIVARAMGLDCGPMSGFDNAMVDKAFFAGTACKSNFICSLGHGDTSKLFPRSPRLDFDEACKVV